MCVELHDAINQLQALLTKKISTYNIERINCPDGFSVSVQASECHYCSPRVTDANFWTQVELGYPSEVVLEWIEYAEDRDDPTNTVYGYVPVEIVAQALINHGFGRVA